MADARKRARRAAAQPAAEPEPRLEPQPEPPESEPVFADERAEPGAAAPAAASGGSGVVLPASGLAEDILASLEGGAPALPASAWPKRFSAGADAAVVLLRPAQQRAAAEATEHRDVLPRPGGSTAST
jgi:hypothetical protein